MDHSSVMRGSTLRRRLSENIIAVRARIAAAAATVDRDPQKILLVSVTKTVDLETIRALLELGECELGENQVQQLLQRASMLEEQRARRAMLHDAGEYAEPHWHMVGHLQRNKVKAVLPVVTMIHSVDTLRLAEEINTQAARIDQRQDILIQVNCAGETEKFGMPVAAAGHFIEQISSLSHLRVCGFMTMAPLVDDPEKSRPVFQRLYELFLEVKMTYQLGKEFEHLSMGMSQDYAAAVECGATMLRVGTALFEGLEASA